MQMGSPLLTQWLIVEFPVELHNGAAKYPWNVNPCECVCERVND